MAQLGFFDADKRLEALSAKAVRDRSGGVGELRTEGQTSLGSFTNGNHGSFTTSLVQSMVSTPKRNQRAM
jgi:hypothetical protein